MSKIYQARIQVNSAPYDFAIGHLTLAEYQALPTSQRTNLIPLANYASARRQYILCDLDEQDFNEIKNGTRRIFLYSQPSGTCSIYDTDQRTYSGLIAIKQSFLQFQEFDEDSNGYSGRVSTRSNLIRIRDTAIHYTAREMTANISGPEMQVIRAAPSDRVGPSLLERATPYAKYIPDFNSKEGILTDLGHPDDNYEQTGSWGVVKREFYEASGNGLSSFPFESGSWDLKPRIYSHWGSAIRFGNETWHLKYDHLSNIHWGYVCAAASLSFTLTIKIAGGPFQSAEDAEDEWPTLIGYNLYFLELNYLNLQ